MVSQSDRDKTALEYLSYLGYMVVIAIYLYLKPSYPELTRDNRVTNQRWRTNEEVKAGVKAGKLSVDQAIDRVKRD